MFQIAVVLKALVQTEMILLRQFGISAACWTQASESSSEHPILLQRVSSIEYVSLTNGHFGIIISTCDMERNFYPKG